MNAVNASTGLSEFQVHMGRSLCILPPLVPAPACLSLDETAARAIVSNIASLEAEAKDALIANKVSQAHYVNTVRDWLRYVPTGSFLGFVKRSA
jgi:hypothetical protein